jgi:hypothetical protein
MAGIKNLWLRMVLRRRVFVVSILLVQIGFLLLLIGGSSISSST